VQRRPQSVAGVERCADAFLEAKDCSEPERTEQYVARSEPMVEGPGGRFEQRRDRGDGDGGWAVRADDRQRGGEKIHLCEFGTTHRCRICALDVSVNICYLP
jgi:hypothetical protein